MHSATNTSATGVLGIGAFVALLCGISSAGAAETGRLSEAQRSEVKALVREYILENPEIITEAVALLQQQEQTAKASAAKAAIRANAEALLRPAEGTVIGNPQGDVTLVEFFDYNCGYCKQVFPVVMDAVKEDKKLRVVLKEFPILSAGSVVAARAALAARKQGKYLELHSAMLAFRGTLTQESVMKIAADIKLDVSKLQQDMNAPETETILKKNHDLAEALGIEGTPALVVGDTLVAGALDKQSLQQLIKDNRK